LAVLLAVYQPGKEKRNETDGQLVENMVVKGH
jgi:hypothetical protein